MLTRGWLGRWTTFLLSSFCFSRCCCRLGGQWQLVVVLGGVRHGSSSFLAEAPISIFSLLSTVWLSLLCLSNKSSSSFFSSPSLGFSLLYARNPPLVQKTSSHSKIPPPPLLLVLVGRSIYRAKRSGGRVPVVTQGEQRCPSHDTG